MPPLGTRSGETRAKLNLSLHVTGRRADGYHRLQSLVGFVDVGDRLQARPASDHSSLAIRGRFAEGLSVTDNLVLRAAALLAPEFPLAFDLEKRLPVASGLGGGSGDAAAALRLVNALAGLGHPDAVLAAIGARLGADVPACLHASACWMEGVGEAIVPLPPLPGWHVLMANPGIPVPTDAVFSAYRASGVFSAMEDMPDVASHAALLSWLETARNDLEPFALRLFPAIAGLKDALAALPGARLVRMSGSGATCFALFETGETCAAAESLLASRYPEWWIASGRLR